MENIVIISLFAILVGYHHKLSTRWKEAREGLPVMRCVAAGLEFCSESTYKIPLHVWLFGYQNQYAAIQAIRYRLVPLSRYEMILFWQYVSMYIRITLTTLFYVTLLFCFP